ncbi:hypothetical protein ACFFHH_09625 [Cytobacillus solani]|uniref:Uncharacterized protein n=1 Tax=Cytobacillus solani TaxID=1637975 RepID=A0A0Q3QSM5_9BACI|nr:hypothetical protein [Cytobacillus solani]KQL20552.1 hypothetical protein AN957_19495 [Cytobacillus solani]
MNENRKNIIVNEILSWKKARMLPEQYCDYLLALYTEGNQPEISKKGISRGGFWKNHYLFILLIPLTLFLIHFTELSITLQMPLFILFVLAGIIFTIYFSRKGLLLQIPMIVSALILLLTSVEFFSSVFPERPLFLYFNLVINCFLWLLCGWKLKQLAFAISGVLGLVLLIIYIFV